MSVAYFNQARRRFLPDMAAGFDSSVHERVDESTSTQSTLKFLSPAELMEECRHADLKIASLDLPKKPSGSEAYDPKSTTSKLAGGVLHGSKVLSAVPPRSVQLETRIPRGEISEANTHKIMRSVEALQHLCMRATPESREGLPHILGAAEEDGDLVIRYFPSGIASYSVEGKKMPLREVSLKHLFYWRETHLTRHTELATSLDDTIDIVSVCQSLVGALDVLHMNGFVHRRIAPSAIAVRKVQDEMGNDLGLGACLSGLWSLFDTATCVGEVEGGEPLKPDADEEAAAGKQAPTTPIDPTISWDPTESDDFFFMPEMKNFNNKSSPEKMDPAAAPEQTPTSTDEKIDLLRKQDVFALGSVLANLAYGSTFFGSRSEKGTKTSTSCENILCAVHNRFIRWSIKKRTPEEMSNLDPGESRKIVDSAFNSIRCGRQEASEILRGRWGKENPDGRYMRNLMARADPLFVDLLEKMSRGEDVRVLKAHPFFWSYRHRLERLREICDAKRLRQCRRALEALEQCTECNGDGPCDSCVEKRAAFVRKNVLGLDKVDDHDESNKVDDHDESDKVDDHDESDEVDDHDECGYEGNPKVDWVRALAWRRSSDMEEEVLGNRAELMMLEMSIEKDGEKWKFKTDPPKSVSATFSMATESGVFSEDAVNEYVSKIWEMDLKSLLEKAWESSDGSNVWPTLYEGQLCVLPYFKRPGKDKRIGWAQSGEIEDFVRTIRNMYVHRGYSNRSADEIPGVEECYFVLDGSWFLHVYNTCFPEAGRLGMIMPSDARSEPATIFAERIFDLLSQREDAPEVLAELQRLQGSSEEKND